MIDAVVAPDDQTGFEPVVDNKELPQLFVTVVAGAEGVGVVVKAMLAHAIADSFTHPVPSSPLTK